MGFFNWLKPRKMKAVVAAAVVAGSLALVSRDIRQFAKLEHDSLAAGRTNVRFSGDVDEKTAQTIKGVLGKVHEDLTAAEHAKLSADRYKQHNQMQQWLLELKRAHHHLSAAQHAMQGTMATLTDSKFQGFVKPWGDLYTKLGRLSNDVGLEMASRAHSVSGGKK